MGRRSLVPALLAALAAGGLLGVWFPAWGASAPTRAEAVETRSEPALRAPALAARLQGRGLSPATDAAEGDADDPCPFDAESIVLRVCLLGYETDGRRPVSAWLRNASRHPVWFTTREGTRQAWFDVTSLFARADVRYVRIHAGHRDYLSEERVFWLPDAPPASRVLETSLRMRRARAVLGRVVDAEGNAAADAAVALYRLDGEGDLDPCDVVATDAEGRFRLRTTERGPHLVLATMREEAWPGVAGCASEEELLLLPGTGRLEIEQEVSTLPRDVVLRTPFAIEGGLTIRGRPYASSYAYVSARLPTSAAGTRLWAQEDALWLWDGATVRPRSVWGNVGSPRFRVSGLAPGPHVLRFFGGRGTLAGPVLADVGRVPLEAPAEGAVVDLDAVLVRIHPQDDEGPLRDARVEIVRGDKVVHHLNGRDLGDWCALRPGRTYGLRIRAPGYEDTRVEQALPLGVDKFAWHVHVPRVEPPRRGGGGCVAARVRSAGQGLDGLGVVLASAEGGRRWSRVKEEGRVVFEDVLPGWWEIRVHGFDADELADRHHSPYVLPVTRSVFVSPGVCTEIDVDLDVGGLLEVAVRDAAGRCVPAAAEVLEAGGRVIAATFMAREPYAWNSWCCYEGGLCPDTPSVTRQALPPGRYEVRVRSDGAAPRHAFAQVRPGRTTSVEIELFPAEAAGGRGP